MWSIEPLIEISSINFIGPSFASRENGTAKNCQQAKLPYHVIVQSAGSSNHVGIALYVAFREPYRGLVEVAYHSFG